MKKLFCAFAFLFLALPASAQLTTVSGTVADTNGMPYANGLMKAQLVTTAGSPISGQPTMTVNNQAQCVSGGFGSAPCQVPFQGTVGQFQISPAGSFTINLQDNTLVTPASTQWLFTVSEAPGVPPPLGTGPQLCITQLTISGASQTVALSCPILVQVAQSALSAKNFGVVADCLRVYDAAWSIGANPVLVTSPSANFNAARDNGKNCFGNDSASGLNTAPLGVLTVSTPTTATCSGTATANAAGAFFAWGTIDDAAWTRARTAAAASQSPTCIVGPNGASMITRSPLIDPRVAPIPWAWCASGPVGGLTVFVPTPTFDPTTCTGPLLSSCIWEDNQQVAIQNIVPQYGKLDNMAVDGMNFRCTGGYGNKAAFGLNHVEGHNIWAWNWCGTAAGVATFNGFTLAAPNSLYNLNANNVGGIGISVQGAGIATQSLIATSYAGAMLDGTDISVGSNAIVVSKGNFWQGCATQCVIVGAGGTMVMDGDTGTGTSGNQFVDVAGTLITEGGTAIIPTNSGAGASDILTRATGKAFLQDTTLSIGAAGAALNVNTVPGGSIINRGNVRITAGTDQTLLAVANVVLSAGWGATATVTAPTGTPDSNPTRFSFQVNSAGAGQAANPTMAITYPAPVPTTPSWTCKQAGGTGILSQVSGENGATTTAVTLTWNGTPTAGQNYVIVCTGSLL